MMIVQLVFGLVFLAGTALQHSSAKVAQFDANNVTKMEFTFQGVPGRDGMQGQPGPAGPQGIINYITEVNALRSAHHISGLFQFALFLYSFTHCLQRIVIIDVICEAQLAFSNVANSHRNGSGANQREWPRATQISVP